MLFTATSGVDIVCAAVVDGKYRVFGNLLTLSISTYREDRVIRLIGRSLVMGSRRGPRTIAGTMIFASIENDGPYGSYADISLDVPKGVMDSAKKFDVFVLQPTYWVEPYNDMQEPGENPHGDETVPGKEGRDYRQIRLGGRLRYVTHALYGVTIQSEGVTFSAQDLLLERVYSYKAERYVPPRGDNIKQDKRSGEPSAEPRPSADVIRDYEDMGY